MLTSPLFTPFSLRQLTLPNRIVMAPMTRSSSPGGVPGEDVAAYYRRRAEAAVGLIITEGTYIDHPPAAHNPNVPRFYGDDALAGWSAVLDAVHAAGGTIMPQLWHVGLMRQAGSPPYPDVPSAGPSGLVTPDQEVGVPMTEGEVEEVVRSYGRGAGHAYRLGFDGVELHGAHGYLIDQFFWAGTNRRTDRYGGGIAERTRFAGEAIQACRRATAPDFPILLRFSQWKLRDYAARLVTSPRELDAFLQPLVDAGVDCFHCSTRRFWQPEFEGSDLNLAGWTKKLSGKPAITVGSVGLDNDFIAGLMQRENAGNTGLEGLVAMVASGDVDLVAIGRALLVDPRWAVKIRDGRLGELMPYTPDALKTLS